jgi:hypothetical protein
MGEEPGQQQLQRASQSHLARQRDHDQQQSERQTNKQCMMSGHDFS